MCGIAGYLNWSPEGAGSAHRDVLQRMGDAIRHRGPDDSGEWFDTEAGIGLVHRRLSIVDLSQAGHQPMVSACGRYVIIFNGEIYNHLSLRQELTAISDWRGHSDTETLVEAFAHWGLDATLRKCVGMFAVAIWDRERRELNLARDRFGEKPLYYGWQGGTCLFASELKAMQAHPKFEGVIDRDAVSLMLRRNGIPAPRSVYHGISKLLPGTRMVLSSARRDEGSVRYWSLATAVKAGAADPFKGDLDEAAAELELLLGDSLSGQMVADVPLGVFLSGGVDSSLIAALMRDRATRTIRSFSIGFHAREYDEAVAAQAVAQHLGLDHTQLYVSPKDALELIPKLSSIYDEPFADVSQIPAALLAHLARDHVTVALTGDAGDEVFGGYNRYIAAPRIFRAVAKVPRRLRSILAYALGVAPAGGVETLGSYLRLSDATDKLRKLAQVVAAASSDAMYDSLVSNWRDSERVILGSTLGPVGPVAFEELGFLPFVEERMMCADILGYLPDDILVKVDRAAMASSLETRVPFLDHRVVEFAWRLPLQMKMQQHVGKLILRRILYRRVPQDLIERGKRGFAVPIGSWLRGALRPWAEGLLDESRLKHYGILDPVPIRRKWTEHLRGTRNWQHQIWAVLMLQSWLENVHSSKFQ